MNVFRQSCRCRYMSSATLSASHGGGRLLEVSPVVQDALNSGRPVVALESTIVAHGMPYPENWNLSKRVASILRSRGVEPATIAIKDGICRVGLSETELEDLAKAGQEGRALKCSTREIPLVVAKHLANNKGQTTGKSFWGATTVASTMRLAHAAGISTFVTGGIGGVHRYGEVSLDISADLTELARTPVIVVSAGIKSILDIQRTLEVLETNGVPVVSYQTDEFPAFFSPQSGAQSPARVESPQEIALAYEAARNLHLPHGMLVAVPNSDPAGDAVEDAIKQALQEVETLEIQGQAVTPFILKRIAEVTGGASLESNMKLVERNAVVGADIAVAISDNAKNGHFLHMTEKNAWNGAPHPRVVVLGGIVVDIVAKPDTGNQLVIGTSNPASCVESDGGVGRNIAEVLGRLGSSSLIFSAVGNDSRGRAIIDRLESECGVMAKASVKVVDTANTATYVAVLDGDGDLHTACADMKVLSVVETPPRAIIQTADALVLDGNPPLEIMRQAAIDTSEAGKKVFLDPTSVPKAAVIAEDDVLMSCISMAFPNSDELKAMAQEESSPQNDFDLEELKRIAAIVLERLNPVEAHLVVTMGGNGVLLGSKQQNVPLPSFRHFPIREEVLIENATGAGDTFCGAFIHAVLTGSSIEEAVKVGMDVACHSLASSKTICDKISHQMIPTSSATSQ